LPLPSGHVLHPPPYLTESQTTDWAAPLTAYRGVVSTAAARLADAELPPEAREASTAILDGAKDFMDAALTTGEFSMRDFIRYTHAVQPAIHTNMAIAAEAQVVAIEALLARWRKELGKEEWRKLYAVVFAIWSTEVRNQHWLIMRKAMDPSTVDDHLIVLAVGEPEEGTIEVALDNLARIVQDKIAAALIFPDDSKEDTGLAKALADPTDLLSDATERAINACPRSGAHRPVAWRAAGQRT
jgi:hypothetical protein